MEKIMKAFRCLRSLKSIIGQDFFTIDVSTGEILVALETDYVVIAIREKYDKRQRIPKDNPMQTVKFFDVSIEKNYESGFPKSFILGIGLPDMANTNVP